MSALRWLAIANPGAGLPGAAVRAGESLLREGEVQQMEVSRFPGDAARMAREALDVDGIVAIGGDGTTFEILTGLDRARHVMALVPVGHGNCLARDLALGNVSAARAALRVAIGTSLRAIDLMDVTLYEGNGSVSRRGAACTFAAGYVAQVAAMGRLRLAGLGRAAYSVASAMTVPRPLRATLSLDARDVVIPGCTGMIVNNTAHIANFRAFPLARLHDSKLDIMGLGAGWPRQLAHNLCILSGSTFVDPALLCQASSVRLTFDGPTTVMLDGELITGIVAVSLGVLPRALRCVGMS